MTANIVNIVKKKLPEYLLLPFAILYGIVTSIRNKLFDWQIIKSHEFNLPVIAVGNITAGGTGKTPHTEYLIELLHTDYRVAVLSRGYRRSTKGFILAGTESPASEIGDEPCQIKTKFPEIMVAVDEKRVRGIKNLRDMGAEVILLDDAFQHRYVKPGLSILLIDYHRPVTKDAMLPFGRLRESVAGIRRANIILITKSPANLKAIDMRIRMKDFELNHFQHLYYTTVQTQDALPVFAGSGKHPDGIEDKAILLVTGIARPEQVTRSLGDISSGLKQIIFPDHHRYVVADAERIIKTYREMPDKNKIILTTEKDAVKLRAFSDHFSEVAENMFYLPVRIAFLNNDKENFNAQICSYVRSNKRNSILHKGKNQVPA